MADIQFHSNKQNRLMGISVARPVLVMLTLYIIAWIIKILDTFVFRLDEIIGEAILTKALGFILVAAYVWMTRRKLTDIGFRARNLGLSLILTVAGFGFVYTLAFTSQLVILGASGEEADLVFSAVDPRTGLSGGLLFGLWLVFSNLVNSAMEEGLFRGVMLRHFLVRYAKWGAIFLQAALFSLWHLSWPLRHLLDGQIPLGQVAFEAFGLTLSTLVSGVVYGYFCYRTNNLWGPFAAHTINNSIFNVLFIRSAAGVQSGLEFIPFVLIFLTGHLLMIPIIVVVANRLKITEVKPWGDFTNADVSA
ncbi:MAG: type II CAAX endopeptidase family protein [Anaerolineae bacterium]|jgi:membrane protease YdiL (CAAX protease family)